MWTDAQMRALHEEMCDRMLRATWLKRYTWTDGKGLHLTWTREGALAAVSLKRWHELLRLDDHDRAPVLAAKLAHGESLGLAGEQEHIDAVLGRYVTAGFATGFTWGAEGVTLHWTPDGLRFSDQLCALCAQLGLAGTEDEMLVLFGIAATWAPDGDTPVVES
jgi:hypothetical protein